MHYLTGAIRFSGRRGATHAAQAHLSVLVGLAVLTKGVGYWFDRYGLEIADHQLLTGINYTAAHASVTAKLILAVIAVLCAILFFANAVLQRWIVPTIGLTLMVLSAIVLGVVYPGGIQYFSVRPDEPDKERPYIQHNIDATRAAYGVDKVQITDYSAKTTAAAGQLRADAEALPGVRLMDPNVIAPTFEQLQQVRGYYSFPKTLDVDRYTINGARRPTRSWPSARWTSPGSPQESQNWNNLKTVYTHGFGLVAAYGNKSQSGGQPTLDRRRHPDHRPAERGRAADLLRRDPRRAPQRLLDRRRTGRHRRRSSSTHRAAARPATPSTYTYNGTGGVPIGSWWNRLLYAAKFADVNILLSDRVNQASKIIYDRTPRERVQKAAPWLTVDGDAYPAVVDGRIKWIVDGYTTSNSYPYSQRVALNQVTSDSQTQAGGTVVAQPDTNINYMRNSVKAVVDAYDGTRDAVRLGQHRSGAEDLGEGVPGGRPAQVGDLARPAVPSALPAGSVQGAAADPGPLSRHRPGHLVSAVRHLADSERPGRRAREHGHRAAVLSVDQVAEGQQRGVLADHRVRPEGSLEPRRVHGGERRRVESGLRPDADPQDVRHDPDRRARADRQRVHQQPDRRGGVATVPNQGTSSAQYGNLLTLPVGGGLLYVQPVYTQRSGNTGSYPALQFVLVRFGQEVGIGATLQQALNQVFQGDAGATTGEGTNTGTGTTTGGGDSGKTDNAAAVKALAKAQTAFANANKALKEGDLAMYATQIKAAQAAVQELQKALGR